jgi:hypothetical protein
MGYRLSALANDLEAIGRRWDRRLEVIKCAAEQAD